MTIVSDVTDWLDAEFPTELAEDWDNTGLLLGRPDSRVTRAVTCLTLTEDVAAEAAEAGASLVVSHHPILFRGAKQLTTTTAEGRTLLRLIEAGVSVYSPHTRFDSAASGINAALADGLNLTSVRPIHPAEDPNVGSGRMGDVASPSTVRETAKVVTRVCRVEGLHVVGRADAAVTRIAVACGAAGEYLRDAAAAGCDGFLTGEVRFHTALEAEALGVALFVPGHYATERPAVERLADRIGTQFPDVRCTVSKSEADPLRWIAAES